tara:strand:- start:26 stop:421 length:396 start_codon:yes stop_codon:yes gene_type:complete
MHPEVVAGRSLWLDPVMKDLIDKLHNGDTVRGWEGDDRLAVYWNDPRWEVWRLEDDNEYRMICRSKPGVPFDERLIDRLCEWDQRRQARDLHREVTENNERITAEREKALTEEMREDVIPRLRHAFRKDGV